MANSKGASSISFHETKCLLGLARLRVRTSVTFRSRQAGILETHLEGHHSPRGLECVRSRNRRFFFCRHTLPIFPHKLSYRFGSLFLFGPRQQRSLHFFLSGIFEILLGAYINVQYRVLTMIPSLLILLALESPAFPFPSVNALPVLMRLKSATSIFKNEMDDGENLLSTSPHERDLDSRRYVNIV